MEKVGGGGQEANNVACAKSIIILNLVLILL